MGNTKQVLRLQSDQILDDPQVGTRLRLKGLTHTNGLNIIWSEPAASYDIEFRDPGANDAVVYENLAQSLTNKTLGTPTITDFSSAQHGHADAASGGTVSHSVIANSAVGDDHTQYAKLAGRFGGQTIIGGTSAGNDLSLQSTSHVTRGEIVAIDNILMGTGKEVVGLPPTPSGPTAAASKAYVDLAVAGGATWKEVLLTAVQLDNVNQGIAQAVAFFITASTAIGDTLTINDGSTSESWVFAAVSAPYQPQTGNALTSMTNLANSINNDSPTWAALMTTTLQSINTTGVVVIYRRIPAATTSDRIYGAFTTHQSIAQLVNYGGTNDYHTSTSTTMVVSDPTTANFGIGRVTVDLMPDEAHLVRVEDNAYIWNADGGIWQLSAGAVTIATSGSGGGTIGQATFDEDYGLEIVPTGIARVRVDGSEITFNGSGELTTVRNSQQFMEFGIFEIVSTENVFADTETDFTTDFQVWDVVSSNMTNGRANIYYEARLRTDQTTLEEIKIPVKGNTTSVKWCIDIRYDGAPLGTNQYIGIYTGPPAVAVPSATRTLVTIPKTDFTGGNPSPTGEKRIIVKIEAHVDNTEILYVGRPFLKAS